MHDPDEYVPVAERIEQFYERHPTGRIVTRLVEQSTRLVIVQAFAYRSSAEDRPAASGFAAERPGNGYINSVACLENAETSAIGRALANLGFSAKRPMRSAAWRDAHESDASLQPEAPTSIESLGVRTIDSAPRFVRPFGQRPPAHPPAAEARVDATGSAALAPAEALTRDVIRFLHDAERHGMRPRRADEWKRRIASRMYTPATLERIENWLRVWIAKAREHPRS